MSGWVTEERLVSLPFPDHCDPLLENRDRGTVLIEELCREQGSQHWKYVEMQSKNHFPDLRPSMEPTQTYCFQMIDLSPTVKELFGNFHATCMKEKI